MALREDYYTPCVSEINNKILVVENLIDELKIKDFENEYGLENSSFEDDIESEIENMLQILEDVKECLFDKRRRLATSVREVY